MLVDTGMDPSDEAIDNALVAAGASWSDLSHVVLTHGHPDHTGALDHVRRSAPEALVRAPEPFTTDLELAETSLQRLRDLHGAGVLFSHGPELADPWAELVLMLDSRA